MAVFTYDPKKTSISLGGHIASGFAEDTFVSIEPNGDGVTKKVGCDGAVSRSLNPDQSYVVKVTVMQTSPTNGFLENMVKADRNGGGGVFPVMIKDLQGTMCFNASEAWCVSSASRSFGREIGNREWTIHTADGEISE